MSGWTRLLVTYAVAASGVAIFKLTGLPLPYLLGPLSACLIAALLQVPMKGAGQLGAGMRTILGVAVGAAITPALLDRLPQMAYSIALVPPFVVLIGLIGYPFFRRVCGFDHPTAYYSAMPGGFQDMVIFGEEAGGDVRALSLIHATRVLIIVVTAPILLTQLWGVSLSNPPGVPASTLPLHEIGLMIAAALIGWKGGEAIGLFGASILGPLAVTALLSLTDILHNRPPAEAILAAQFFIGTGIGVKYAGVTLQEIRRDVAAGVAYVVLLAGLSFLFAWLVSSLGFAHPLEAFLAFAPGGQAEMAVLAIVAGADLAFVVTHHMVRIIIVIAGSPIAARLLR
ncbi:AbrB family transcriptional regulator [Rhodobacteraceae bacterium NNCM2]|nr:AbrB family transcriptional regulator [Coraliihabitans acroporae]